MIIKDGKMVFESLEELYLEYKKQKQLNNILETRLSELSVYEGILRDRLESLYSILQQELADVESRIAALPTLHTNLLYEESLATELPYILSEETAHLSVMKSKLEQVKSELDRELSYRRVLDAKGVIDTSFDISKKLKYDDEGGFNKMVKKVIQEKSEKKEVSNK